MGFFSRKISFLRRNWNKCFFSKFSKNREKIFDFLKKKLEKKFEGYISVKKSVKK